MLRVLRVLFLFRLLCRASRLRLFWLSAAAVRWLLLLFRPLLLLLLLLLLLWLLLLLLLVLLLLLRLLVLLRLRLLRMLGLLFHLLLRRSLDVLRQSGDSLVSRQTKRPIFFDVPRREAKPRSFEANPSKRGPSPRFRLNVESTFAPPLTGP